MKIVLRNLVLGSDLLKESKRFIKLQQIQAKYLLEYKLEFGSKFKVECATSFENEGCTYS